MTRQSAKGDESSAECRQSTDAGGVNHQQNKAKARKTTEAIITKSRQVSSESRRGRGHQRSMSEEQRYECRESSPTNNFMFL